MFIHWCTMCASNPCCSTPSNSSLFIPEPCPFQFPIHLHTNIALSNLLSPDLSISHPHHLHTHPPSFPFSAASPQAVPERLAVPRVPLEVPAAHLAHVWLFRHARLVLPVPHNRYEFYRPRLLRRPSPTLRKPVL